MIENLNLFFDFRFHFWQPTINEHESGWIRGLSSMGYKVNVYYDKNLPTWRSSLGLGEVNYGDATVSKVEVCELFNLLDGCSTSKDLHFFTGIKEFPLNRKVFKILAPSPANLFYISESKDTRGIKGTLRYIRDIVLDYDKRRRVDAVLAMGDLGTTWFAKIGFNSAKIYEFGYAVSDPIRDFGSKLQNKSSFRVVYVGQLIKRKRIDTLISAIAHKKIDGCQIFLDIVGNGEELEHLTKMALDLGIEDIVKFSCALPNSEVRNLFRESDLLILPSAWDGWGAVTNEALLAGCRVGISDMAGSASLCKSLANCFVFPCGDVSAIANQLHKQVSIGKVTFMERTSRMELVRSLIGETAITNYLLHIIDFSLTPNGKKPHAPWAAGEPVTVAYHFFPHYREAVFLQLLKSKNCDFRFAADLDAKNIDPSIKAWLPPCSKSFYLLPVFRFFRGLYWQPKMISWAIKSIDSCVILLGDPNNLTTWISGIVFRIRGKRVIFWAHGWIDENEPPLKKRVRKLFFSIPNGLLLYGRRAKRIAMEQGFCADDIWVVFNSLDYSSQKRIRDSISTANRYELRQTLFGRSDVPVVACITRLTSVRRLDILIGALAELKSTGRECFLLLIGDGPERTKLETQAKELGVILKCTGALYEESLIGPLLSTAALTVAPGKVGLTAMHSLAYGIPVLTHGDFDHQMPECEAIVPGLTGDFFTHNDQHSLATLIERWTESVDVKPIVQQHCINVIERFYNPENQVKIIEDAVFNIKPASLICDAIQTSEIRS